MLACYIFSFSYFSLKEKEKDIAMHCRYLVQQHKPDLFPTPNSFHKQLCSYGNIIIGYIIYLR